MARTIVVTGAASGIGKATAELLESGGDRVLRIDLREGDVIG
ncbi:MAG: short-chain dehydrogenase, partial [Brachybacterium sp.]|nr:short-chain dehydrogenase [Brachybacterium sp.]